MSSQEFDTWVAKTRADCARKKEAPTAVAQALKERLKAGVPTSDEAVTDAVGASISYELGKVPATGLPPAQGNGVHGDTCRLADEVVLLLGDRWLLQARLRQTKAGLMACDGRSTDDVVREHREVLRLLDLVSAQVEPMRMEASLGTASALFRANQRNQAEKVYQRVLRYFFARIKDDEACTALRECNSRAASGLINCRAGDAKGLRELYSLRGFHPQSAAYLKEVIEGAEAPPMLVPPERAAKPHRPEE